MVDVCNDGDVAQIVDHQGGVRWWTAGSEGSDYTGSGSTDQWQAVNYSGGCRGGSCQYLAGVDLLYPASGSGNPGLTNIPVPEGIAMMKISPSIIQLDI
jgi:hypothetical protein